MTVAAGMGIPEDDMRLLVINPETKAPIAPMTLRKHFREQLDLGFVQANAKVGMGLFANATTKTDAYPGGLPIAQIFWLKCRARWQQNPERNPVVPPAASAQPGSQEDVARRLAFLLASQAHQPKKKAKASA